MPAKKLVEQDSLGYWKRQCARLRQYEDAVIAFSEIPAGNFKFKQQILAG